MKYQRLFDRKTFACIGLSVGLSVGLSLSICAVKGGTTAQRPTPSVSQPASQPSLTVLSAEGN